MPPKKEKGQGAKKGGKEKSTAVIDGLPISTMSREQVEGHVVRLRDELDREREEGNYFQLERDKMQTFWEVSKHQLEEKKAELRNRDRDLEEAEERHLAEIKVYKQKIKHLMHDHQCKLSDAKTEHLKSLKEAQENHLINETKSTEERRELSKKLREHQTTHQDGIQALRLKNSEDLGNLRLEFQKQIAEIESKYEIRCKSLRNELELRRKNELHDLEERKNQQINNLIKNHNKAFTDIKNYYNDITVNNLALITTLKEQIEAAKKKEDRLDKRLSELMSENKKLYEPLQKAQQDVGDLQKVAVKYERDKVILTSTKARLKAAAQEIKDLQWEREVLEQKFKQLQNERDDLHEKFLMAIQEVQQKSSFKNVLLETKLRTLEEIVEHKDVNRLPHLINQSGVSRSFVNSVAKS